jgi:hypothetical protein
LVLISSVNVTCTALQNGQEREVSVTKNNAAKAAAQAVRFLNMFNA